MSKLIKRKKLDILKRLPNGSIFSVIEEAFEISVELDGRVIFFGWTDGDDNKMAIDSLETIIKGLAAVYERLELYSEENKKSEGA